MNLFVENVCIYIHTLSFLSYIISISVKPIFKSFSAPFYYRLNNTYTQLLKENEVLQMDHKNLKTLLNNSKLEQTRLEAEFSRLKEQYQQLDITHTKLNNQCEVISLHYFSNVLLYDFRQCAGNIRHLL